MNEKDQLPLGLPGAEQPMSDEAVKQAKELSEVAKLSAEVIEKGLVRETRPVFVFDKRLAEKKSGNAARQEKFRVEREKEGLKMGMVPVAALEKVKKLGGGSDGWIKYIASISNPKNETQEVLSGGVAPAVEPVVVIKEVFINKDVIKEVPGPVQIQIEKVEIEKPMSAEQKKTLYIGEKVRALTGFRRKIVKFLLGI